MWEILFFAIIDLVPLSNEDKCKYVEEYLTYKHTQHLPHDSLELQMVQLVHKVEQVELDKNLENEKQDKNACQYDVENKLCLSNLIINIKLLVCHRVDCLIKQHKEEC